MDFPNLLTLPIVTTDGKPVENPYCGHRSPEGQSLHAYCPASYPQYAFHQSEEKEVFYGGAAGPGKTIALLHEGLRYVEYPTYRAIFFRRTYGELAQVIDMAMDTFPQYGGKWKGDDYTWVFPSGARYYLRYLERDADKLRYQGHAFHFIAFDELTQWPTDGAYKYLFTRNRPFKPERSGFVIPCRVRAASNPGGPGHGWVKQRFVDNCQPYQKRAIRSGNGRLYHRVYVPATLDDNPILLNANGGDYETSLMSHPDPAMREALRYGNWNISAGAVFLELREKTHRVNRGEKRPDTVSTVCADWAYAGECYAAWVETDHGIGRPPRSRVYQEWSTSGVQPSVWAAGIVQRSLDQYGTPTIKRVVLDSAAWATPQDGSPSPAEQMLSTFKKWGITLAKAQKGPNSIRSGIVLLHSYFWISARSPTPLLVVDERCPLLWQQLTTIQRGDPEKGQDIEEPAPRQKDDRLDALRYWAADRPKPAPVTEADIAGEDEDFVRAQDQQQLDYLRNERMREARVPIKFVRDILKSKVQQRRRPWER